MKYGAWAGAREALVRGLASQLAGSCLSDRVLQVLVELHSMVSGERIDRCRLKCVLPSLLTSRQPARYQSVRASMVANAKPDRAVQQESMR
jgi:hypothetical protein